MHLPVPSEGGDFAPPPAGAFPAFCFRFIDLGTQTSNFNNETKHQRKVMLSWELADDQERMEDGRPWTISQRYTWSMHEKATLRKTLESWRGIAFEDKDFGEGGFDTRKLLGAPCMLSLVHADKGDKKYTNISAVTKLPRGMQPAPLVSEQVYFTLDAFDAAVFSRLSDSLQTTIKASPEYQALGKPKGDNGYHAPGFEPGDPGFTDENIPF
jgi:hypothetical protein